MPASFRVQTSDTDALRVAIAGAPAIDHALGTSVTPRRSDPSVATP
ncbi:MAG TPA: hypothetical protein VL422_15000 [Miltoncostaea sp.]|nr:hypothetical protein [Miltoncostaea sp.]